MKNLFTLLVVVSSASAIACDEVSQFSYCKNDEVITSTGLIAEISGVFRSGSVSIKFPGDAKHYNWNTQNLAVTDACSERSIIIR